MQARILFVTAWLVAAAVAPVWALDADGDGVDDLVDVCCHTPTGVSVDAFGRPLGDVDADCDVDLADFAILANNLTGAFVDGPCGLPNGDACTNNIDCASGFCRDGYCCDQNCQTPCRSCGLAGLEGTCSWIPLGQDPDDECVDPAVCDGIGHCASGLGAACGSDTECLSGFCRDGVCCNSNCGGTCMACDLPGSAGVCAFVMSGQDPDAECAGPQVCDGAGACGSQLGAFCVSHAECLSGFCVDNRCCDGFCNGTCEACDVIGSFGTCTFIPDGTDPDDECGFPFTDCDGTGDCG